MQPVRASTAKYSCNRRHSAPLFIFCPLPVAQRIKLSATKLIVNFYNHELTIWRQDKRQDNPRGHEMISAIQTSIAGMTRASDQARTAAAAIVRAPAEAQNAPSDKDGTTSEITAIIDLSIAAQSYKANATVLNTTNDMLGKLLDSIS
ncbi:hypothetical protein [Govanella unica]|uniref:Flagellar basal-body/hook protein C-terminal domain-containing protein n=1 Tax=Govanella unica TaxID=2975056 RepID=A0A9X3Z7E1_9PROT|nr:hypothetical protein [Govania unica]MDA5194057.1 hypothetical protein [Govania unica]